MRWLGGGGMETGDGGGRDGGKRWVSGWKSVDEGSIVGGSVFLCLSASSCGSSLLLP